MPKIVLKAQPKSSGTPTVDLTGFEQYIASYIPFIGNAIDYKREQEIQKALVQLYDEADAVTVLLVKFISAELWWASHIASAAADALGYAGQIKAALAKADSDMLDTWAKWLTVKYPADLRKLYSNLVNQIDAVKKELSKEQKANLKPLEDAIAALQKWKKDTVTPELKSWLTFHALFKKTYAPPLHTVIGWLHKPATLADFVALPLIGVLPTDLRKPAAHTAATSIATALTDTWANDPQKVYESVLDWLLAT